MAIDSNASRYMKAIFTGMRAVGAPDVYACVRARCGRERGRKLKINQEARKVTLFEVVMEIKDNKVDFQSRRERYKRTAKPIISWGLTARIECVWEVRGSTAGLHYMAKQQ